MGEEDLKKSLKGMLPFRIWDNLRRNGIKTVEDLVGLTKFQLSRMDRIGPQSIAFVSLILEEHGLSLEDGEHWSPPEERHLQEELPKARQIYVQTKQAA